MLQGWRPCQPWLASPLQALPKHNVTTGCWAAGMVSASVLEAPVVAPAHHHVRLTDHGSFFGRLTSEANPVSYLAALQQVFTDFCRDAVPVSLPDGSSTPMPLVVNTPGWVKVRTQNLCGTFSYTLLVL